MNMHTSDDNHDRRLYLLEANIFREKIFCLYHTMYFSGSVILFFVNNP